jgi:predicted RNA-binding Zn-ribbon protein involved in translation (DUF1610 family)
MLISCPECNTKVSDKASVCPHCGFRIDTLVRCPECGKLVLPETVACPVCGYPFPAVDTSPEEHPDSFSRRAPGEMVGAEAEMRVHNGAPVTTENTDEGRSPDSAQSKVVSEPPSDGNTTANTATNLIVSPLPGKSSSRVVGARGVKSQQPGTAEETRDTKRVWYSTVHGLGTKRVWYYMTDSIVYGPTFADDIYGRILDGRLPQNVSVWMQGSLDWAPATDYVLFSREGPDAADVAEQEALLESGALPPMVSMDGRTKYAYSQVSDDTAPGTYASAVAEPHPWIRFFARMFDIYVFANLLMIVFQYFRIHLAGFLLLTGHLISVPLYDVVDTVLSYIVATTLLIPIESLWLCLCGTTPGKWLLGVSVRSVEGRKPSYGKALRRSALVCVEGLMFEVPVLSIVCLALGFRTLNRTNTTPWDLGAGTVVQHRELSALRAAIIVLLLTGFVWLAVATWKRQGL